MAARSASPNRGGPLSACRGQCAHVRPRGRSVDQRRFRHRRTSTRAPGGPAPRERASSGPMSRTLSEAPARRRAVHAHRRPRCLPRRPSRVARPIADRASRRPSRGQLGGASPDGRDAERLAPRPPRVPHAFGDDEQLDSTRATSPPSRSPPPASARCSRPGACRTRGFTRMQLIDTSASLRLSASRGRELRLHLHAHEAGRAAERRPTARLRHAPCT